MAVVSNVFKDIINYLRPIDNATQNEIVEQGIVENKPFTLKNPRSTRYTWGKGETNQNKFKYWKPKSEKDLSPSGYFQEQQIKKQEEENPQLKELPLHDTTIPSTCLRTVKYDPAMESLTVQFQGKNSKKYWYPNVPANQIINLMKAPSKGQYFLSQIHDQYTLNPGHKADVNKAANQRRQTSYKYAQKQYNRAKTAMNKLGLRTQQALAKSFQNQGTGKVIEDPND